MRQVILDTSFILSAIEKRIDIFEELLEYKILIPNQVLIEVKGILKSNPIAKTAMKILKKNKFKTIDLKTKNTDAGIIKYSKQNPMAIIATLDRNIQRLIKNKKLVIRGKKKLEIN